MYLLLLYVVKGGSDSTDVAFKAGGLATFASGCSLGVAFASEPQELPRLGDGASISWRTKFSSTVILFLQSAISESELLGVLQLPAGDKLSWSTRTLVAVAAGLSSLGALKVGAWSGGCGVPEGHRSRGGTVRFMVGAAGELNVGPLGELLGELMGELLGESSGELLGEALRDLLGKFCASWRASVRRAAGRGAGRASG